MRCRESHISHTDAKTTNSRIRLPVAYSVFLFCCPREFSLLAVRTRHFVPKKSHSHRQTAVMKARRTCAVPECNAFVASKMARRKPKCLVIFLIIILVSYCLWNYFHIVEIFGPHDVVIASSSDVLSWLDLTSSTCKERVPETKLVKFRYLYVKLVCQKASAHCHMWNWDVANWTVIYMNGSLFENSAEARFCPIPVHGERLAKVVRADGKVEYPDCPNSKTPCAPSAIVSAHFDKKLRQRINVSPCCRKQTMEVTQHMARVFDKHKITYLLVGGAVIGLVRDAGSYVPYDTDTDVGVDANDYDKLIKALPELEKPGYTFKWVNNINEKVKYHSMGRNWYMVGCANKKCHTGPGIALYLAEDGNISARAPPWSFPIDITVPPIRRMFEGMEMSFPKEPEKYLDLVYGKGRWRTPLDCTKHYYGQCKA